nr:hypothetical protein [Candidatus Gracilibacteria bacterium]
MKVFLKTIFRTTSIYIISFVLAIGLLTTFALTFPTGIPSGETPSGVFMNYFNKILVNTGVTTDGTVKMTEKVINQDCGTGKLLQGFDGSGNIICISSTFNFTSNYPGCNNNDIELSNGLVWAACNVGSSVSGTGVSSYGDLFQWGRNTPFSSTGVISTTSGPLTYTAALLTTNFITGQPSGNYDWLTPQNDNLWGGTGTTESLGTYLTVSSANQSLMQGPCANGYHVPTIKEWCDSIVTINPAIVCTLGSGQTDTLVASTLKLPFQGYRLSTNGVNQFYGVQGAYYSSSPISGTEGRVIAFGSGVLNPLWLHRANAASIRCLRNN